MASMRSAARPGAGRIHPAPRHVSVAHPQRWRAAGGPGPREIPTRLDAAAANYAEGEVLSIETISKAATNDLGYAVEIERLRAKVGERGTFDSVALRTTSVLRREGNEWRLVHRHADPLVEFQAAESIVRR
jgi:ketosteroid isomerase-like protein